MDLPELRKASRCASQEDESVSIESIFSAATAVDVYRMLSHGLFSATIFIP